MATITSPVFQDGKPFNTPAFKIPLTKNLVVVRYPFDNRAGYMGGLAFLPKGLVVDGVFTNRDIIAAPDYSDRFFTIQHNDLDYLVIASTTTGEKGILWNSSWTSSWSAAMTAYFHMLGRLGDTSWGDYIILAAE